MHLIFLGAKEMSTFFLCDTKIKFLRLFSILRNLKNPSRFNPHWKILENVSKYFFKILPHGSFSDNESDDFWKTHPHLVDGLDEFSRNRFG